VEEVQEVVFRISFTLTNCSQSQAYMNDKLHKSNKRREINDINTPSLSV